VRNHTLTSSFLQNLFFFSWQPWTRLEATVLEPMVMQPGEGRGAFVQRVQYALARELGSPVAEGFTVHHKRSLAQAGGKRGSGGRATARAQRRRATSGGARL
jgi:hypothetical protein